MLLQVLDSTLLLLQIPSLGRCCCNPTLMQIVYVWSGLERVFPKRQARQFVLAWLPSQTMFLLQAHAELAQVPKNWIYVHVQVAYQLLFHLFCPEKPSCFCRQVSHSSFGHTCMFIVPASPNDHPFRNRSCSCQFITSNSSY